LATTIFVPAENTRNSVFLIFYGGQSHHWIVHYFILSSSHDVI
jgi:hypothetical protein